MKKYIIVIVNILLISTLVCILIVKNNKKYVMYDGMMLAITLTDGEGNTTNITKFPSKKNYTVEVDCGDTAVGKWLVEDWKLAIEDIKKSVKCIINFRTITNDDKLIKVIQNKTDNYGNINFPGKNTYNNISKTEYGTTSQYSATSSSATSGTSLTNAFTYNTTNNMWSSVPSNLTAKNYHYIKMPITKTGNYQLCYSIGATSSSNSFNVFKNGKYIDVFSTSSTTDNNSCVNIGLLTGGVDYITVSQYAYSSFITMSFNLKISNDTEQLFVGYRYNGKSPNNYVWFNNELWRIIGLIPACTNATNGVCSERTNLVKIIRNESIGGVVYDAKASGHTGKWGSNTLYLLLNNYYYGQQNGTNTDYCYGYITSSYSIKRNCDYTTKGIDSDGYYGQMIEDVYWNNGFSLYRVDPGVVYGSDMMTVITSKSKIGVISASDYGYASTMDKYNVSLELYNTSEITGTNWLYGQGKEWMSTQLGSDTSNNVMVVGSSGALETSSWTNGALNIRPVVYLNENVYVISGKGTINNPYVLGM